MYNLDDTITLIEDSKEVSLNMFSPSEYSCTNFNLINRYNIFKDVLLIDFYPFSYQHDMIIINVTDDQHNNENINKLSDSYFTLFFINKAFNIIDEILRKDLNSANIKYRFFIGDQNLYVYEIDNNIIELIITHDSESIKKKSARFGIFFEIMSKSLEDLNALNIKISNIIEILYATYGQKKYVKATSVDILLTRVSKDGEVFCRTVSENITEKFYNEAYPNVNNLDKYMDEYFKSEENVLILSGEPGTGKTKFIRKLLLNYQCRYIQQSLKEYNTIYYPRCVFISDHRILENYQFYDIVYNREKTDICIIEDADDIIRNRGLDPSHSNVLSQLLSLSDGILKSHVPKLIISTNLLNTNQIDPAFTREGRCFELLKFNLLNVDESIKLLTRFNVKNIEEILSQNKKDSYSLAELYRIKKTKNKLKNRNIKLGF
jgi:hypothetical protein